MLQKANGVESLQDTSTWYTGHTKCQEMQGAAADVCRTGLREDMQKAQFIGLMVDESIDVAIQKRLVITIKIVKDGQVQVLFGENVEVENGKAVTIVDAIRSFLVRHNVPLAKLIGLGTDGASVMTGRVNGVHTVLQRLNPSLVTVWCCAHKLSLVCHYAAKSISSLERLQATLVSIYKYFKYSATRAAALKKMKRIMKEQVKRFKKPTSVRWLSLHDAVKAVHDSWGCLVMMLEQEAARNEGDTALTLGLLQQVKSYKFIGLIAMLRDVLDEITKCSLKFQEDEINIEAASTMLEATLESVGAMPEDPGKHLRDLNDSLRLKKKFQGIKFTASATQKQQVISVLRSFVENIQSESNKRFPEADMGIVKSLDKILNPKYVPADKAARSDYGKDILDDLLEKFPFIDGQRARSDYRHFKFLLKSHQVAGTKLIDMCSLVIREHNDVFPDFATLAEICMVIPLTSVPCERAFSVQNSIMSTNRSRMLPKHLNNKMLIVSNKRKRDLTDDAVMEFAKTKRLKLK